MTRYLNEIKQKYGTITSFFISDNSKIYYHADGILKTVSIDDPRDKWYFRVQQMEDLFEINIDPDQANRDALTIFINYRVFDYVGNYIGVTGVGLTVNAVSALIEHYQKIYGRQIYFVDTNGDIQLHGSRFHSPNSNLHDIFERGAVAQRILDGKSVTLQVKRSGNVIHVNTRFIPEFNWHLIVEQEEGPALRKIGKTLAANLLICLLVSLFVLWLASERLTSYRRRIEKMAVTDKLTGAYNRHAFDPIYRQLVRQNQRDKSQFATLLLDIDLFKQINDTYGHLVGDQVIREVVEQIRISLRSSDPVFRWGGEEFLVLLRDCNLEDAEATGEKVLEAIRSHIVCTGKGDIHITASMGVTQFIEGDDPDSLIHRADVALYRAKEKGRDNLQIKIAAT
jgi:diguanylate cyclase (GGDEF)-like protein